MKIVRAWGSHLPVLIKTLSITSGDVLEMGMGLYSTPFMHWACFQKRNLVSYDNEPKYFAINSQYQDDFHKIYLVDDWDKADIERPWDVALIDHAPAARRIEDIRRLAPYVKYIVVHDTQGRQNKEYHYTDIYPLFKYRYEFNKTRPFTSVLSNLVDLTNFSV